MRFLVDAQLPARLARLLNEHGHDATHTPELPNGNRTPDDEIAAAADAEGRVVISKDRDFRYSHFVNGTPRRLLVVHTGNISNNDLLDLIEANLEQFIRPSTKPLWRSSDSRASRSTPANRRSDQHRDQRLPKQQTTPTVAPTTSSRHPSTPAAAVPRCSGVPSQRPVTPTAVITGSPMVQLT